MCAGYLLHLDASFAISLTCFSINLAYAELYIMLAGIFRKYDLYDSAVDQKTPTLALFETTRERDLDIERDFLVSRPKDESKGIRVLVR